MEYRNALGQPVGFPVPGWTPRPRPPRVPMIGRTCRVEPLGVERHADELHADELHAANRLDVDGRNWTYLAEGPFAEPGEYRAWLTRASQRENALFHAIADARGESGRGRGVPERRPGQWRHRGRQHQLYSFQFEGIFRQHWVVKGRNRDTAWHSITDAEWPAIKAAFARWLDPANFDAEGRQRVRLSELMPETA